MIFRMTGRSVSRLADSESILLLPAAQAMPSQPRTHSVACKHVVSHIDMHMSMVSRENDSNFNCI